MVSPKLAGLFAALMFLAACEAYDKTVDRSIDSDNLSGMVAGIWIDPNGCDHWIIDDGLEGYLSARLDRYGKPVCSGVGTPGTTVGKFKNWVPDPI